MMEKTAEIVAESVVENVLENNKVYNIYSLNTAIFTFRETK